jgi:hypothetical protein
VVAEIDRSVESSPGVARLKPVSGMTRRSSTPRATSTTPPTTTGAWRSTKARATAAQIPARDASLATCAPRWYEPASRSGPTSSASQASIAPLLNVQPKPISAAAKRITPTFGTSPVRTKPSPITNCATTTDARRLYTSATTPVGTSNRKYATSRAVPASTSSSGLIPTSRTK